jgi:predicted nucleic acid-binding protein
MTVFIHDASILLDLIHVDLLRLFLTSPARMVTTDFVVREVSNVADKRDLEAVTASGSLQVVTSDLVELESIAALQSAQRTLSTADCSVLFYARKLQAVVLTGDSRLRREATQLGLDVHGTVWAFDELVGQGLLAQDLAADNLEELLAVNPRLPREECERMIRRWRK